MAALSNQQVTMLWQDGNCESFALFAVKNCNSGDTVDMSGNFRTISGSIWMEATPTAGANVAGTNTGTTLSVPSGLTNAGCFVLVGGITI